MKMNKYIYFFTILALILGIIDIFLFIFHHYNLGFIVLAIYYLILFIFNYLSEKKLFTALIKTFLAFILFPFYPLILLLQYKRIEPLYKPINFYEHKLVDTSNIGFSSVDLAPFNIILKYGDPNQRKYVVRLVYNSIKEEKIDFIGGINLIRNAIKEDTHPDVILYASDALTNLENHLISKISHYMGNLNTLEDYINYAKYSYYYANSGFLAGEHKFEVLWQSSIILRTAIEMFPESPLLIVYTLRILESLNEYENLEEVLNEKINKIRAQELYEYAIMYYIKRRKPKSVQKLVSEFIDLGFSPEHESIKFLLGG
ncbi:hypothetical protein [Marinitoga aeolica]|uniref:Uncharacterized protein n=1 Tax=Marinitoga aeolica TaxID=2809031 RepID=A0ABY8PNF2_9BACT|nr:hypothetical protein [Marinitoga aeolica]WGS64176.1 hypothetical protein JRV97_07275 [Marinitoga aeolica]